MDWGVWTPWLLHPNVSGEWGVWSTVVAQDGDPTVPQNNTGLWMLVDGSMVPVERKMVLPT